MYKGQVDEDEPAKNSQKEQPVPLEGNQENTEIQKPRQDSVSEEGTGQQSPAAEKSGEMKAGRHSPDLLPWWPWQHGGLALRSPFKRKPGLRSGVTDTFRIRLHAGARPHSSRAAFSQ